MLIFLCLLDNIYNVNVITKRSPFRLLRFGPVMVVFFNIKNGGYDEI